MPFFSKNPRALIGKDVVARAMRQITDKTEPHHRAFGDPHLHVFEQTISDKLGGVPVLAERKIPGALFAALRALGVVPGDEIIISAFCPFSNISPILWLGATPVFVDICLSDYALDPSEIEKKITARTKAIIVTHLFGQPALGMSEILEIAQRKSLPVVENASSVFMAKIRINDEYRLAGTLGDIGCFGFLLLDAGVTVFRKGSTLYDKAKKLRIPGAESIFYEDQMVRFLARLKSLDHRLEQRRKLAAYYTEQLSGIREIILPKSYDGVENMWYHYIVRTKRSVELLRYLSERGVKSVYKSPVALFPGLQRRHGWGFFPMSEKAVSEAVFLPILLPRSVSPFAIEDVAPVIGLIKDFFKNGQNAIADKIKI